MYALEIHRAILATREDPAPDSAFERLEAYCKSLRAGKLLHSFKEDLRFWTKVGLDQLPSCFNRLFRILRENPQDPFTLTR